MAFMVPLDKANTGGLALSSSFVYFNLTEFIWSLIVFDEEISFSFLKISSEFNSFSYIYLINFLLQENKLY